MFAVLPRYWPSKSGTLALYMHCYPLMQNDGNKQLMKKKLARVTRERQALLQVLRGEPNKDDDSLGNWQPSARLSFCCTPLYLQ